MPLVIVTAWLGVYPKPVLEPINNSVESIVTLMHEKAITEEAKSRIPNPMQQNSDAVGGTH